MAESTFDRPTFESRLATRELGRHLIARAELPSTNDAAWEALGSGCPDGTAVVADAQPAGRGRAGRTWHTAPGRGLALSVLFHRDCDRRPIGVLPLVAGLALASGLERLGAAVQLKWPNDLLLDGRKVSGILAESRRVKANGPSGDLAVVIGAGVNVSQSEEDFPPEMRHREAGGTGLPATSLALAGFDLTREEVAAEFLNALEPMWADLAERGRRPVLEAWRRRATFWGRTVSVLTPAGRLSGSALTLDDEGRLVLALASGERQAVMAGDVELDGF